MTTLFSYLSSSEEESSDIEQNFKKEDPMILWREKYGQSISNKNYILTNYFGFKQKMEICINDFIPFYKIPQDVLSWGDYQMDSEETPGTDEYEERQNNLKETLKKEKKQKQQEEKEKKIQQEKRRKLRAQLEKERKRKEKEREKKYHGVQGVILGGEKYYTDWEITKAKNAIAINYRNKLIPGDSYVNIDAKSEQFLKDLVFLYHPKKEEKKEQIDTFVYGLCKGFHTLCAILKDGTLDTFSQKKPVCEIVKKGLIKEEKKIQKKYRY